MTHHELEAKMRLVIREIDAIESHIVKAVEILSSLRIVREQISFELHMRSVTDD